MSTLDRATGGNRFIPSDAGRDQLALAVHRALAELDVYFEATGRHLDVGAISVETKRIPTGAISVTVMGDPLPAADTNPRATEPAMPAHDERTA